MKKQVMFAVIFAGCIFQVEAKKVNNNKNAQAIYDTNMALLTAYGAQAAGLGGKKEELKSRLKIAKKDQRQDVVSATDAQKQQALSNARHAHPEAREAANNNVAVMYGTKDSSQVQSFKKQMSDLEKTITNNNRNISAAYKKAKDAALVLDRLNGNSDMIKAFNKNRRAAHVAKVQGGTLSDASSQYRHSNAMGDVQDRLEKFGHYQQKRDAKRAKHTLKKANEAVKVQQAKAKNKAQKAAINQKKKGKGKRAASSSNNHVVLMDKGGWHGGFYEVKPDTKLK